MYDCSGWKLHFYYYYIARCDCVGRLLTLIIRRYCARDTVVGSRLACWLQYCCGSCCWQNICFLLLSVVQIVCAVHSHISLADYSWYKAVLWMRIWWIRIKLKVRIRIRIRIKVISRIRIRIRTNLQMTSQNIWNMRLFEHLHTFSKFWACLFG